MENECVQCSIEYEGDFCPICSRGNVWVLTSLGLKVAAIEEMTSIFATNKVKYNPFPNVRPSVNGT